MEQTTEPCIQVGIHGHHGQISMHLILTLGMFALVITMPVDEIT